MKWQPASRYVADPTYGHTPANPLGIQRHPYMLPGWGPAELGPAQPYAHSHTPGYAPVPVAPQGAQIAGFGQEDPVSDTTKTILALASIALLLYLVFGVGRRKSNPGLNKIVKVTKNSRGWYYKLMRKRAKRHGPFATASDAITDANSKGYEVFGG